MRLVNEQQNGDNSHPLNRRELLARAGGGLGLLALGDLLRADDFAEPSDSLAPMAAHFIAKAKAVIWLFMEGGPSAVDTFDPKPALQKHHGKTIDIKTFNGDAGPLLKSPFQFRQFGECGAWVCENYAHVARHVDDIAFIRSCHTDAFDHVPALYQMNTGLPRAGFPSAGAWVTYGLGSENRDLPGFIVLGGQKGLKGGPLHWSSGFLPTGYQGTLFRAQGSPLLNLRRPETVADTDQRAQLDLLAQLNREHLTMHAGEPDLTARIASFELAYRMQMEAAELVDFSDETRETQELYGLNANAAAMFGGRPVPDKGPGRGGLDLDATRSFGAKCLLARRLVERGVRFVQVYSDGDSWDAHGYLIENHSWHCAATDIPISGLLTDLKRRGLFDSTLVIWGSEFGRTPTSQLKQGGHGRDHNPEGFLVWMAGAGIRGGVSFGETDEFGHPAVVDPVSVHDLHATMLHLLGIEHKRLTYLHNGRRYRLTDVAGNVLTNILA